MNYAIWESVELFNQTMQTNTLYLPASTRRFEDFGFMQAYLSFKPHLSTERQNFGSLITIDDGTLQPGATGFGLHPHKDVEVVTFMVSGEVKHIDPNDASHNGTLKSKGVQIITAGSGIAHNEENNSSTEPMRALQIWFTPRAKNLSPNYKRKHLESEQYINKLTCILSPDGRNDSLLVQQDVYLNYGNFAKSAKLTYQPRLVGNQSFIYIIEGEMNVIGQQLEQGDGFGIKSNEEFSMDILEQAEFLVFDVPR
ncbi:putative quercetin 2,3-dioxygenase [Nymphon striatum]|nr:putative quercetin 2,3-dioxygenase [Nymphon striatum]